MAQHGIEMILMRRLAGRLTMPMLLVDPEGGLVYYNSPAAHVLGAPFEEPTPETALDWAARLEATDSEGREVPRDAIPIFIAAERQQPSHERFWLRGVDGARREIEGIAFPLVGQGQRMLGAVGVFWDLRAPPKAGVPASGRPIDLASPGGDRPLELLLMRQLASYLDAVIFLIGPDGSTLFFNEPAEQLVGRRFDELDEMSAEEWMSLLPVANDEGDSVDFDARPMMIALRGQRPAYRRFSIRAFDGSEHPIEGLGFPLVAREGRQLGAVGIFWRRADR